MRQAKLPDEEGHFSIVFAAMGVKHDVAQFFVRSFEESGVLDTETAARYREEILSKGGTRPGMELYVGFRGREPEIGPLLEKRGLK